MVFRLVSLVLLVFVCRVSSTFAERMVGVERISTGIVSQQLYMDRSANYVCIFGQPPRTKQTESSLTSPPQELVVVDLGKREVIKRCPSAGWVRAAIVSDSEIVWAIQDKKAIVRLRFDDSSHPEETEWGAPINELFALGSDHIGMVNIEDRYKGTIAVYDRASFTKIDRHPLNGIGVSCNRYMKNSVVELGDSTLWVKDRILDENTGKNRCFTITGRKPPQLGEVRRREVSFPSYDYFGDAYWRRGIEKSVMKQFAGDSEIRIRAEYAYLSKTHPLVAKLLRARSENRSNHLLEVEFQDLVLGQVLGKIQFPQPIKVQSGQLTRQKALRVECNIVLVAYWDEVFVTELPESIHQVNFLKPLRLTYPRVPIVNSSEILKFKLTAKGGQSPYRFDLQTRVPGVTVDRDSGAVAVDFSVGWKVLCETLKKKSHPYYRANARAAQSDDFRITENLGLPRVEGEFHVSLPVEFVVTDQSGQRDRIFVSLLSTVSLSEFAELTGQNKSSKSIWNFFGN